MRTGIWLLLLLVCGSGRAVAQVRVEGTVLWQDGSPAAGLTVAIPDLSLATTTDADGRYAFDSVTPAVRATVTVALDGRILARRFGLFTLAVERIDFQLTGTRVAPGPGIGQLERGRTGGADAPDTEVLPLAGHSAEGVLQAGGGRLDALPTLGARDALGALTWLPGVAATERAEGLEVDAARAGQGLVRFDGFTLYRANHVGLVSAVNMHGVDSVEIRRGAFDARLGDRLTHAIEIGSPAQSNAPRGGASASLVDVAAAFGTPIGGAASFWAAGRKSVPGPLDDRLLDLTVSRRADFDDAHGRFEVHPSSRDRIGVSAYIGHDDVDGRRVVEMPASLRERLAARGVAAEGTVNNDERQQWRSTGVSARWEREWSPRIRTSARYARSDFDWQAQRVLDVVDAVDGDEGVGELNVVDETTAGLELAASFRSQEFAAGGERTSYRAAYRLGAAMTVSPASPLATAGLLTADFRRASTAAVTSLYVSHRGTLGGRLAASSGLRVSDGLAAGESLVQPRLTVSLRLHEKLRATGAWGHYRQVVSDVPVEDLRRGPRGFWTLVDGKAVPAPAATNAWAGLTYTDGNALLVEARAFARRLDSLSMLAPRITGATKGVDLSRFLYRGSGAARGVTMLAQARVRRNSTIVGYTGSRATYDFPAFGGPFPADHNRRHEFKIVDAAAIGPLTVSGAWVRASGRPYTAVTGLEVATEASAEATNALLRLVAGPTNGARLPSYHRFDVSATYELRLAGNRRAALGVTALNVYDRANAARREYAVVGSEVVESTAMLMRRVVNVTLMVRF